MTIEEVVSSDRPWTRAEPAPRGAIERLKQTAPVELPSDYLNFLSLCDGGDADLPVQPWLVGIWSAEEVLSANDGYHVSEFIPGFFGFGTSGGGELFAFDTRSNKPWPVVIVPFIVMSAADALPVAPDFLSFANLLGLSNEPSDSK